MLPISLISERGTDRDAPAWQRITISYEGDWIRGTRETTGGIVPILVRSSSPVWDGNLLGASICIAALGGKFSIRRADVAIRQRLRPVRSSRCRHWSRQPPGGHRTGMVVGGRDRSRSADPGCNFSQHSGRIVLWSRGDATGKERRLHRTFRVAIGYGAKRRTQPILSCVRKSGKLPFRYRPLCGPYSSSW